ncbi:hypothetical protein [Rhizobium nepotum]|uniref:hypothetical protein n=1 Tax=Rhizobium nepotum TaxID=1035271 RepID=UPI003CEB4995
MGGFQFVHLESWSCKADDKGRSTSFIFDEASRKLIASVHVPDPKPPLQELIMDDCKHAHDLINSIAAPLQPAMVASVNWRPARLTEGTTWRKVQELLSAMGGANGWPGKEDFVPWPQAQVIPLLRFVVHGETLQGDADGGDRADAAAPLDKEADDGPLAFDDMPSKAQETVENALDSFRIASPVMILPNQVQSALPKVAIAEEFSV